MLKRNEKAACKLKIIATINQKITDDLSNKHSSAFYKFIYIILFKLNKRQFI